MPEILIVDEVLSVGDFMFQQKCERRITQLIKEHDVTVLIVSHNNDQDRAFVPTRPSGLRRATPA